MRRGRRLRLWSKQSAWSETVAGARFLKRATDVLVSAAALVTLAPRFPVVSRLVRRHDGGPVLFRQTRVGRSGREFPFPKFRSMRVDAEAIEASLLAQNDHQTGITFKTKNDPG